MGSSRRNSLNPSGEINGNPLLFDVSIGSGGGPELSRHSATKVALSVIGVVSNCSQLHCM